MIFRLNINCTNKDFFFLFYVHFVYEKVQLGSFNRGRFSGETERSVSKAFPLKMPK